MIHTDIDLKSTYIGGSEDLINKILADPALEAFPADPSDKFTWAADIVNT